MTKGPWSAKNSSTLGRLKASRIDSLIELFEQLNKGQQTKFGHVFGRGWREESSSWPEEKYNHAVMLIERTIEKNTKTDAG